MVLHPACYLCTARSRRRHLVFLSHVVRGVCACVQHAAEPSHLLGPRQIRDSSGADEGALCGESCRLWDLQMCHVALVFSSCWTEVGAFNLDTAGTYINMCPD